MLEERRVKEFGMHRYTAIFKMDNQKGPTVQHKEPYSMLCGSLEMRGEVGGKTDTCICMAESLGCSPETITTLLTSHSPIENKRLKKVSI